MTNRRSTRFSPILGPTTHPDHHLWRNGRRWWIAFTYHTHDFRKARVRCSLGTCDVEEARRLRDEMFAKYEEQPGRELSLRFGDWDRPKADPEFLRQIERALAAEALVPEHERDPLRNRSASRSVAG